MEHIVKKHLQHLCTNIGQSCKTGNDDALHLLETRGGITRGLTKFFFGAHKSEINEDPPSSQVEIPAYGVARNVNKKLQFYELLMCFIDLRALMKTLHLI